MNVFEFAIEMSDFLLYMFFASLHWTKLLKLKECPPTHSVKLNLLVIQTFVEKHLKINMY